MSLIGPLSSSIILMALKQMASCKQTWFTAMMPINKIDHPKLLFTLQFQPFVQIVFLIWKEESITVTPWALGCKCRWIIAKCLFGQRWLASINTCAWSFLQFLHLLQCWPVNPSCYASCQFFDWFGRTHPSCTWWMFSQNYINKLRSQALHSNKPSA